MWLGGHLLNLFDCPNGCILVTGRKMQDARRDSGGKKKRNESEGRRIWSIKIVVATSSIKHQFHPLMILRTFLTHSS